jgi:hypothetical protein
MPKGLEVGQLRQTSYWLAQTLSRVIQLHAGLAAIEPASRAEAARLNFGRLSDAEDRLALAIEGFGEVVLWGKSARAARIVSELEVPRGVSRRPSARHDYRDLIRWREEERALRRKLERLRQEFEETPTKGPQRSNRPRLRAEIRTLEDLLGEGP